MADNNPPRLPGNFQPGKNYLLSGDTLLAWRRDLMADRAIAGPGITESQTPQGRIFQIQTAATAAALPCPFGEIFPIPDTDPPETGIRGGLLACGPHNWLIDPHALDLTVAGTWLVSIPVNVTVNRDDDEEILLPGIADGTKPTTWTLTPWTSGTDYPAATPPAAPDGTGTCIVPIGKLTITIPPGSPEGIEGTAALEPVACGHILIDHCAGTLLALRGPAYEPMDPYP